MMWMHADADAGAEEQPDEAAATGLSAAGSPIRRPSLNHIGQIRRADSPCPLLCQSLWLVRWLLPCSSFPSPLSRSYGGGDRGGSSFGGAWGSSFSRGGGGGGGSGPCYSFKETGVCRYGDSCRFTHDGVSGAGAGGDRSYGGGDRYGGGGSRYGSSGGGGGGPCYQFQRDGSCRYGDSCRFSHGDAGSQQQAPMQQQGEPQPGGQFDGQPSAHYDSQGMQQ